MKRNILIFGNSGSGKTTLANKMSRVDKLAYLDLDNIAWDSPGIRKALQNSLKELDDFIALNESWVIEGCYGSLLEHVASFCNEMYFLNPGIEACLSNNLFRPWESHKYDTEAAQNKNFEMLQSWVREYASRTDEYSLSYHRKVFSGFSGVKQECNLLSGYESFNDLNRHS